MSFRIAANRFPSLAGARSSRPILSRQLVAALAAIPLLAGCSSTSGSRPSGARPSVSKPLRQPVKRPPPAAQIHMAPGLEGVIGATANELTRLLGTPRLDVHEGDARKLQFSDTPCVLDVYLYPLAQGREPQATYVDARRSSDGRDVDKASCVAALRKR